MGTSAALGTCTVLRDLEDLVFRVAPAAVARTCRGARLSWLGNASSGLTGEPHSFGGVTKTPQELFCFHAEPKSGKLSRR